MPHTLVLSSPYMLLQSVTNNRKVLSDPLLQHTSYNNKISQRVPIEKEKHVLKQDTLYLYNNLYRA